ncbi:MAG: type II toxin-antitoxin system HicB family antitoxin [Oscillibacter sp.]|nr:type II toxin-antitoxin system HicB family antitoxin [Oscillibacter sp.]
MPQSYPACFFKEENGWSVVFPDLNWLATCGETREEAEAMAVDCLTGYLRVLREDGDEVPPPSVPEAVHPEDVAGELNFEAAEAYVGMVTSEGRKAGRRTVRESMRAEQRM